MQAYCAYTKRIDFPFYREFFWNPKAYVVCFRSWGPGYDLNILENGRKGGHFGGARNTLLLLLCQVLQLICGPIVLMRNVSIFSFSVGFSENKRHLEVVLDPGDRVMSSIYWKMGEKAIILEERVVRCLYYYDKFYRRYLGVLCLNETYRFSLFQWVFLKTKGFWS